MPLYRDIVQPYSPMVKQALAKHTPWLENSRFLTDKCIKLISEKELFQGLFNSFGRR